MTHSRSLKLFWVSIWNKNFHRVRLVLALSFSVLIIGIDLTIPFILRWIVNTLSIPHPNGYVITLFVISAYGILWTTSRVLEGCRDMLSIKIVEGAVRALSVKVFSHIFSLSFRYHHEQGKGSLVNDVLARVQDALPILFWDLIFFTIPNLIQGVLSIGIVAFLYGPLFSLILGFACAFFLCLTVFMDKKATLIYREARQTQRNATAYVADKILNFETVKYFSKEEEERGHCEEILAIRQKSRTRKTWYIEKIRIMQGMVLGLVLTLTTLISGYATLGGHLSAGDFILLNGYLFQFISPLYYMGCLFRHIREALTDLEQVDKVLKTDPEIKNSVHAVPLKEGSRQIVFDQVNFSYDQKRMILKKLSFIVGAGQTVAFVGPTGSGKSTIPRLLFRFYDLSGGRILIDDQDISQVTQDSLHHIMGMVPQDASLFDESLYYNIAYGNPKATEEDILKAAKMAQLGSFIKKLPLGLKTVVGERGVKLSGGEKQRIAIARVLLKDPEIFIFDEATSALDTQTEKEIQANLWKISRGKTTLIIAHRLSTIVDADKIIVLKEGAVVEEGSHAELLRQEGFYTQLWEKQTESHYESNSYL